ncbi:MAG: aminotransferase class I/II-fold pyridoxal phosphate-dependent enzyme, partial [Pseudomonadota bacterium]
MDVMSQAAALEAQGRSVVHMEVGQPGFPAPQRALDAVKAALPSPLGYTVALGRDELRAGVAALYRDWYGLDLDPRRVVMTTGSSAGFQLAFLSLFDAGDRVAIADPGYPSYRNILKALDLNVVRIEGQVEILFQP